MTCVTVLRPPSARLNAPAKPVNANAAPPVSWGSVCLTISTLPWRRFVIVQTAASPEPRWTQSGPYVRGPVVVVQAVEAA